jgi:hypothetical protein
LDARRLDLRTPTGDFVLGALRAGDFPLGDFVLGDFVLGALRAGDFPLGDFVLGDFVLGALRAGDFPLGDFVLGDFVLGALREGAFLVAGRFGDGERVLLAAGILWSDSKACFEHV